MNRLQIQSVIIITILLFGGFTPPILAYVMESNTYRLQSDSINVYGGRGTSTSYHLEDSAGEIATGYSDSTNYKIHAGFQQTDEAWVALSIPDEIILSPSISGLNGGIATGSGNIEVTTNDRDGYSLKIKASTNPAMQSATDNFANYTPAGTIPDYTWLINQTNSEFGFSPEGLDITQRYLDNGSICNQFGGSDTTDHCWDFLQTTDKTISQTTTYNHTTGESKTQINFQAESGTGHMQSPGTYEANITITATVN